MKIERMAVEYKESPIGMDEPCPRFFYRIQGDEVQQSRRITVEKSDGSLVWDSGIAEVQGSCQIAYAGMPLEPFTRYVWKVEVSARSGAQASGTSTFETGFMGTPWHGKWISGYTGEANMNQVQVLRCKFQLENISPDARLYITALGLFDAKLNGKAVSDECFAPGWTNYFQRVQYCCYDISSLLKKGENELFVQLGEGWYCGRISRIWNGGKPTWGTHPMLKAELHCLGKVYASTGPEWRLYDTPVKMSDIYMGERYDGTHTPEIMNYAGPGGDVAICDSPVKIQWRSGAPIRRVRTVKPKTITRRPNGVISVDFGENLAGREILHFHAPGNGAVVTVRHGEMLNEDGSLYTINLRSAAAMTTVILPDTPDFTYEPLFTWYGFRYVEISGWPEEFDENSIEAAVIASDLELTGSFRCSEVLVNRLFENIIRGQRSNFLDVPTDCPQRDERLGWTGDTQVFANAGSYNMYAPEFYTKWIEDLNCAQIDGIYPNYAPDPYRRKAISSGWGDAGVVCPWQMYRKYGDTRIIRKYLPNMVAWLDVQQKLSARAPLVENTNYGDWLNMNDPTSSLLLCSAYLAGMNRLVSQMARICGEEGIAAERERKFQEIRKAFLKEFYTADGHLKETSQTACLLTLHFGLAPEKNELYLEMVESLLNSIEKKHKMHLSTGFLGTPLLLPVLTECDALDTAYSLLLQSSFPGWLYPVTQGATTMWERWNSWTKEDGFGNAGMNSFNHYAYGAVGDWFYETICGIKPDPTFKKFRIDPRFGRFLKFAECSYNSIYGLIRSRWERKEGGFLMEFTIPGNTEALVRNKLYGPGTYTLFAEE